MYVTLTTHHGAATAHRPASVASIIHHPIVSVYDRAMTNPEVERQPSKKLKFETEENIKTTQGKTIDGTFIIIHSFSKNKSRDRERERAK
jgi:hypothetical protein